MSADDAISQGGRIGSVSLSALDPKIVRWRFAAAVVTVPLVGALLMYLAYPIVWWLGNHGSAQVISPKDPALAFAILGIVFGFLVVVTAALPLMVWLIQRGHTSIGHFTLAGIVLGNLPFAVYLAVVLGATVRHLIGGTLAAHLSPITDLLIGGLRAVVIGSVMGAASAVVFWLVAGLDSWSDPETASVRPVR